MSPHKVPQQDARVINLVDAEFIYQNSPCGYLSFYPDGTIFKVNQTLLSWLHTESEAIIGTIKFSSLLSKGGRFYYEMVVLPMLQMQGFANEINFEIKSKEESFPCLFNASAVKGDDGTILAFNAIILNITDRKKYELLLLTARQNAEEEKKRFEFLSNTIPNIIWTALPTGEVDFVNERFFQTFGNKTSSLRLNSFIHLIHITERRRVLAFWKKSLETRSNFEAEVRFKMVSQKYEWFLINAVPYEDKEGNITAWFGSCTNINDQKEKERQTVDRLSESLFEAGEVITRNSKALREIAFNQSHLIRHPLTNIMGITNIMNEMEMNEGLRQMVAMLQISADKLDTVIKDIVFITSSGKD